MITIPAQEIKRRCIVAVDSLLEQGAVHVIKNNQPRYVILTEDRYNKLLEIEEGAALKDLNESLSDLKAGKIKRFKNVDALMKAINEKD